MSADDDEPEVPADEVAAMATVSDDGPAVRLPPGPGDRPITNLPPPDDEPGPGDEPGPADETAEERRVEAELGRLGSWLEPEEEDGPGADVGAIEATLPTDGDQAPEVPDDPGPVATDGEPAAPAPSASAVETEALPAVETPAATVSEADAAEAAEPDRSPPGEPPAAPRPAEKRARRRRRVLAALLVVAAVSTAFAVTKTREANDLRTERDDRRAIEVVAGRFASAYLSYDFAHVEESGRAVTALATREFSRSYAAERAPGIQELFTSRQTTTRATTTEVFVGSVGPRTARALVVVDVIATSPTEGEQRLEDVSFVLDLARTTVGWRVDAVDRAPQASVADGPTPVP